MGPDRQISSEESALREASPIDRLKLSLELSNKRVYSPEEARRNIAETLLGLASVIPGSANALSLLDAINAKEAAAKTDDPEAKKRLGAQAIASALLSPIPFRIGLPAAGSASRLGVFVPVAEQGRAEMGRQMFRNLPKNYSRPDKANRAVFDQLRMFFGPAGEAKEVLPDTEMRLIGELRGDSRVPLSDVIQHPRLFERLPQAADIPVDILPKIRQKGGEGYHRPIARSEGGVFQISENGRPEWIKSNIAKLLQYDISENTGFPAAARHSLGDNLAKIDETIAAVEGGLASEAIPAETALPYLEKLEKTKARVRLAQEVARTDVGKSPWLREQFPGASGPIEASEARRAISRALNARMAGNVDAKLAQQNRADLNGEYPYAGRSLGEMIALPQRTDDVGQLAEFLRNWRTYGQGAPQGR